MASDKRSTRDLVIEAIARLANVEKNQENHLRHHWAITIVSLTVGLTSIFTAITSIIIYLLSN